MSAIEDIVRAIVREELAKSRVEDRRTHYSQRDGELPPGVSRGTYLRLCREHADDLGVIRRGKSRLVPVERWAAWVSSQNRPRLRLVSPPVTAGADAGAELLAALGLRGVAR